MAAEPALVLHIWPGRWSLPSIDQSCLEAVLLLQLTCPGRFSIVETVNPDLSPSGHLPFLTHHQNVVSSLPSIISYISSLNRRHLEDEDMELPINLHLDAGLPPKILAQRTAWRSYIETHLGDLLVSIENEMLVIFSCFPRRTHSLFWNPIIPLLIRPMLQCYRSLNGIMSQIEFEIPINPAFKLLDYGRKGMS